MTTQQLSYQDIQYQNDFLKKRSHLYQGAIEELRNALVIAHKNSSELAENLKLWRNSENTGATPLARSTNFDQDIADHYECNRQIVELESLCATKDLKIEELENYLLSEKQINSNLFQEIQNLKSQIPENFEIEEQKSSKFENLNNFLLNQRDELEKVNDELLEERDRLLAKCSNLANKELELEKLSNDYNALEAKLEKSETQINEMEIDSIKKSSKFEQELDHQRKSLQEQAEQLLELAKENESLVTDKRKVEAELQSIKSASNCDSDANSQKRLSDLLLLEIDN